jgi:hypothetical protein
MTPLRSLPHKARRTISTSPLTQFKVAIEYDSLRRLTLAELPFFFDYICTLVYSYDKSLSYASFSSYHHHLLVLALVSTHITELPPGLPRDLFCEASL